MSQKLLRASAKRLAMASFAVPVFFVAMSSASAQTAQTSQVLPVTVVTAARYEQSIRDVLPALDVISREEVQRSQAVTLADLIEDQPGVEIGRNGGPGTLATIFMRGQASNNVAVFVDGVPVQRDSLGGLKLVDMPTSQIEKVEILRGNMAAIYGESAVGGVIHIFTRNLDVNVGPTASVGLGSRNTSDLSLGYNFGADDYKLGLSIQRLDTAGYSAMNSGQAVGVNPDKDGLQREFISLRGEKKLSQALTLGARLSTISSAAEYDGSGSSSDTHKTDQKSDDLTIYSRAKPSEEWSSEVALTQSNFKTQEFKNGAPTDNYFGDQLSLQWGNTFKIGAGHATFGVDSAKGVFRVTTPTRHTRESRGYRAGYSGHTNLFDYQINIRHDNIKAQTGAVTVSKSATTWLLGAGYHLTDKLKITSLSSTSFRAPNTAELFDVPAWGTSGNSALQPEEHSGIELGFVYQTGSGSLRLVHFNSETKNAINYSHPTYENIGKVENSGLELSFVGAAHGLNYKLSAVKQDPVNATTAARLARRAKEYASIDLTTFAFGVDWGTKIKWSGNRVDDDVSTFVPVVMPSYTVVDFSASKPLNSEWVGRVKVENIFNERYQLAHGFDAVPRGIFVTLQYRPK